VLDFPEDDIEAAVGELAQRGAQFLRYGALGQDAKGTAQQEGGPAMAWFADPAGREGPFRPRAGAAHGRGPPTGGGRHRRSGAGQPWSGAAGNRRWERRGGDYHRPVAGYYLVECDGVDRATEIAARLPEARYDPIEIRRIMEGSEFGAA
jgi:hypothetical protein